MLFGMNHDQKANGDIRERVMYCSVLFFYVLLIYFFITTM